MIRSYKELYTAITGRKAVTLSVINPKQDYVLSALREAEERGWINSRIISHEDDAAAAQEAVRTIRSGEAQLLMKGDVDTAVVLKAVLHP
ncbi:MAG: hypothetical protein H8D46_04925, partial [FCB group bacterium]|nr:hypothetical protein [FCB group bacterium]